MIRIDKKFLTIDIDSGSEEVKANVIANSRNTPLNDFVLSFNTETEIVFCMQSEITEAFKKLPRETIEKCFKYEEIHDFCDDIGEEVTVKVMNILELHPDRFFYALQDAICEAIEQTKDTYNECFQWLKLNGIECIKETDTGKPQLQISNQYTFELSDREMQYRAELWREYFYGEEKKETTAQTVFISEEELCRLNVLWNGDYDGSYMEEYFDTELLKKGLYRIATKRDGLKSVGIVCINSDTFQRINGLVNKETIKAQYKEGHFIELDEEDCLIVDAVWNGALETLGVPYESLYVNAIDIFCKKDAEIKHQTNNYKCPLCLEGFLREDDEAIDSGICSHCGEMSYFQDANKSKIKSQADFPFFDYEDNENGDISYPSELIDYMVKNTKVDDRITIKANDGSYIVISHNEEGISVDYLEELSDEPTQTDQFWFTDYIDEDKDSESESGFVCEWYKNLRISAYPLPEKDEDGNFWEAVIQTKDAEDFEFEGSGQWATSKDAINYCKEVIDREAPTVNTEGNKLIQIQDEDGPVMLTNTNLTSKEITNAVFDEELDEDENLDYEQKLTIHAKRLNKFFQRVTVDDVVNI